MRLLVVGEAPDAAYCLGAFSLVNDVLQVIYDTMVASMTLISLIDVTIGR